MVDMPALAAKYPPVAIALKAVGLTPEDHDVYRAALAGTFAYGTAFNQPRVEELARRGIRPGRTRISADSVMAFLGVTPTSPWATNLAFMTAHPDEFTKLEGSGPNGEFPMGNSGMWDVP